MTDRDIETDEVLLQKGSYDDYISKEQALRILRLHDLSPTDRTEFLTGRNRAGDPIEDFREADRAGDPASTFYAMLGNRKTYSKRWVLNWLGY